MLMPVLFSGLITSLYPFSSSAGENLPRLKLRPAAQPLPPSANYMHGYDTEVS